MHSLAQERTDAERTPLHVEADVDPKADRAARASATLQAMKAEPYIDLDTAAVFLAVKPSLLYEWVRLGKVPSVKSGKFRRFKVSELEAWMQSHHEGNGQ